ncbi:MAG: ATP-binding cassette domain-containing protein [Nanoarchaeota archaeon]|nr:ATP-binding cassette domain-containing protein [Nanoarchaeota archaeon]MBU1051073.1 ATP-binding cassette domain-containing protein [Nanoarchaeota archaeon]
MSLILVDGISKSFRRKKILDDVFLDIKKGEIIGLVGRSGAGKSVFVKVLVGFLKPDRGSVTVNSNSKSPIGFSMQENAIYDSLTVKQNLNKSITTGSRIFLFS